MSFEETHVQVMAKMNLMMKTYQLFLVLGQILNLSLAVLLILVIGVCCPIMICGLFHVQKMLKIF